MYNKKTGILFSKFIVIMGDFQEEKVEEKVEKKRKGKNLRYIKTVFLTVPKQQSNCRQRKKKQV